MKRKRALIGLGIVAAVLLVSLYLSGRHEHEIVLTGIVTTDEVIVSSEVQGRVQRLLVNQGDEVTNGQLVAVIRPQEQQADMAFYTSSERQSAAQVAQAEADLKFQESQTSNQIHQAEANLAAAEAQITQAQADREIAQLNFDREKALRDAGVNAAQAFDEARTTLDSTKARVEAAAKQAEAARAAVALAKSNEEQITARRAALDASRHQLAAASAQKDKASVHLDYTEIHAPIDGVVDVRAALQGEVVNPGQSIITLINPDNLWVRADVEESYIDRILLGDKLAVKLPSGRVLEGVVFYRSQDADFATQRDVSRTKRDIKTFEIRLRCDNHERRLAVGMTSYVTLKLPKIQGDR